MFANMQSYMQQGVQGAYTMAVHQIHVFSSHLVYCFFVHQLVRCGVHPTVSGIDANLYNAVKMQLPVSDLEPPSVTA